MSNHDEGDWGQTDFDQAERAEAERNLDEPSSTADEPWSPPDRQPRGAEMAEVEDETLGQRLSQEEPDVGETEEAPASLGGDDPDAIPAERDVLGGNAGEPGAAVNLDDEAGPEADAMHLDR